MPFLNTNSTTYRRRVQEYLYADARMPDDWPEEYGAAECDLAPAGVPQLVGNPRKWRTAPAVLAYRALYLAQRFDAEYNYEGNRRRYPNLQDRVAYWLSGLAINVAYTYADIEVLAREWHSPNTLTDAEVERCVDQWFKHLALHILRAWRAYGIEVKA